ncbi:MAG: hypothetical protein RLZZ628_2655 [Bacteroidota bacterium]
MRSILICCAAMLAMTACKETPKKKVDNGMQEVQIDPKLNNADIIRNPVTASQPIDTNNVAKIAFEVREIDFGTVPEGTLVKKSFTFTNNGKVPLLITSASSSCGCTVPTFNKSPIAVGASDAIQVQFDTKGKQNFQEKIVTITANTLPSNVMVSLKGTVTPKSK